MNISKALVAMLLAVAMTITLGSCRRNSDYNEDAFDYGTLSDGSPITLDKEYKGLYYVIDKSGNAAIVGNKITSATLIIPEAIDGHSVTEITDRAFYNNIHLTTISLPETVTIIGDEAFSECEKLVSISVGSKVSSIGAKAFFGTPYIEESTEEFLIIGDQILINYAGSDSVVTIPEGVKTIVGAFLGNSALKEVTIPEGVTTVGAYSFSSCMSLEKVNYSSTVTSIGERAFSKCTSLEEILIPDSVTEIGDLAYMYCYSAKTITFSSAITAIPNSAFISCSALTSVEIPSNITSIGNNAFSRCKKLTSVTIPDSVTVFGTGVFSQASADLQVKCSAGSAAEKYCKSASIDIVK